MSRTSTLPEQIVFEEICSISEVPNIGKQPGFVTVLVGRLDDAGNFIEPQVFERYDICGADYAALIGDAAPDWAPDKPAGTFRNQDLWYWVDAARAARQAAMAARSVTSPTA